MEQNVLGKGRSAILFKFIFRRFKIKNKSFVRGKVSKNHSLLRRLSKLKKALFIPISVGKTPVLLNQS